MLSQSYLIEGLKDFFDKCVEETGISLASAKNNGYSIFDENIVRSINAPSDIKAQAISILRNNSCKFTVVFNPIIKESCK